MLSRVKSGGQTGADQAGPRPEFAELYGAYQLLTPDYEARTQINVRDSEATVWFGSETSPGCSATLRACRELSRPWHPIPRPDLEHPQPPRLARWIADHRFAALNIAGNRELKSPGIGEWVERYMAEVFRLLAGMG